MYVRLAFAVAAHLQPEILIIDEVLAVGDAGFQKDALAKMKDVSRSGRTVLFVSHQMQAVSNLCDRAILLKNGKSNTLVILSQPSNAIWMKMLNPPIRELARDPTEPDQGKQSLRRLNC